MSGEKGSGYSGPAIIAVTTANFSRVVEDGDFHVKPPDF